MKLRAQQKKDRAWRRRNGLEKDYTGARLPEHEREYFKKKVVRLPPQEPTPPDSEDLIRRRKQWQEEATAACEKAAERRALLPPEIPFHALLDGDPSAPRQRIVGKNFRTNQPINLVVRVSEEGERSVVDDSDPQLKITALASGERQVELLGACALPEPEEELDGIHISLEDWEEEWCYDPTPPLIEKPGRCCKEWEEEVEEEDPTPPLIPPPQSSRSQRRSNKKRYDH